MGVHVSFIRHEADIDVTADVAVRVDAIEQVVNQCETGLTDAEKRRSTTLGAELGNLTRRQPLRWTVSALGDVAAVAEQIYGSVREDRSALPICPFGCRVRIPRAGQHSARRSIAFTDPGCAMHASGCGCPRARTKRELDQLIQRCEALLINEDDLYLPDFRALSERLCLRR